MAMKQTLHGRYAEDADLDGKLKTVVIDPAVDAGAVAAVVEEVLASLSGDMTVTDLKLYHALEELAHYIQNAKREIAEIQPHDIPARIPAATDELDAVVEHTAKATGDILDVCETIEKLVPQMPAEMGNTVASAITRVYEACNFQDVTGQRITKVVKTLKYIEAKIDALLGAFEGEKRPVPPPPEPEPNAEDDSSLMHGPQLPANAMNQDEIDAILASFDK